MKPVLSVRDLSVTYHTPGGEVKAVDQVSFELVPGEVLGVVGESGSGKSSLALALGRLLQEPPAFLHPSSRVEHDGVNLLELTPKQLRPYRGRILAWIFQDPGASLNPVIKVGDQLAEAILVHHSLDRRAARRRARSLLAAVGIPDPAGTADSFPHQLSGGMQQRVAIALALAGEPKILIADEPTTALDVTVQAQILALLAELRQQWGMAILLVTHDLAVLAEIADRVAVMYAGQLVEEGPNYQVLGNPGHPYTEALLRATPRLDRPTGRLFTIPGTAPGPGDWPPGCRFHPRCYYSWERCGELEPPLLELGPDHRTRCWLAIEPQRKR